MGKISISLRKSAWLLALLIITSALPARAQSEFYDEFYDDLDYQEFLFKFDYRDDLNGYIVSPNGEWVGDPHKLQIPSIYLKDGEPVVGLSGFGGLKYLDQIIFPENCHVKEICDNCFQQCEMLGSSEIEELTLPESVETIGNNAFRDCTGLLRINLSSNLKSIGVSAFENCKSLTSITLPKSLKVIREYAFQECTGLQSVVFED